MVQNVSAQSQTNQFGTITKLGTTQNGRIIYQITDAEGTVSNKLSVSQAHSDTFEKSYQSIIENASKMQQYQENLTPREAEKIKHRSRNIKWSLPVIAFLVPAILVKPKSIKKEWVKNLIQSSVTAISTIAGFVAGQVLGTKTSTPPGATELAKATQTLSKLDIQPVNE